jgi:hypothetical protein
MRTPDDVWAVLDPLTGMGEQPDGSNNAPPITEWYYGWRAAWCAMTVSYGLALAGFSDDGGETLNLSTLVPGLVQTTAKGWAFVPYLRAAFEAVGLFDQEPRVGDIGIVADESHTFLVWRVNADGTVNTVEGNYGNRLTNGRRRVRDLAGFCHPPYVDTPAPPSPPASVPPFPGMMRRGSTGAGVRALQTRLVQRGWNLSVDGSFGPVTDRVVRGFQADKSLEVDGIVGPITWATLWTAPIT